MLSHNGTDYTLIIAVVMVFVLLAAAEYLLCAKTKRRFLRFIPFSAPAAFLALIPFTIIENSGGFLDLRGLAIFLEISAAAICLAAIGVGWLLFRLKKK